MQALFRRSVGTRANKDSGIVTFMHQQLSGQGVEWLS